MACLWHSAPQDCVPNTIKHSNAMWLFTSDTYVASTPVFLNLFLNLYVRKLKYIKQYHCQLFYMVVKHDLLH